MFTGANTSVSRGSAPRCAGRLANAAVSRRRIDAASGSLPAASGSTPLTTK